MTVIGRTLGLVLGLAQLVLLMRLVVDWGALLAGPPAHGSIRARAAQALYAVTEPVLAPVRRLLPPLRFGGVGIDLSFILVFVVLSVLRSIVSGL
jgi:YggT family protein